MGTVNKTLAAFAAVLLAVLVVVGGYQLGWWLKEDAVQRDAKINASSYGRQMASVSAARDLIIEINGDASVGQKKAMVSQACAKIADVQVENLPQDLVAFYADNC